MVYGQIKGVKISQIAIDDAYIMVAEGKWGADDLAYYIQHMVSEAFSDGYGQGHADAEYSANQ